jgi:F-type H+-transporting ATPase subunit delta
MTQADKKTVQKKASQGARFGEDALVVKQYAEAFVNAASQQNQAEGAIDDLEAIDREILEPHPEFQAMLGSPRVGLAQKDRVLVQLLEGKVADVVLRFLRVLNRHGRLGLLSAVASEARAVWDRRHNRIPVQIRTAVPLEKAQEDALRDRVAKMISATPIMKITTDPSLVGGLIIQVGDQVFDASLKNRLEQVRQRLIEGKTHEIQSRRDQFIHSA